MWNVHKLIVECANKQSSRFFGRSPAFFNRYYWGVSTFKYTQACVICMIWMGHGRAVFMYEYVYICMYVYIDIDVDIDIYMYICMYIYVCVCVCVCFCVCFVSMSVSLCLCVCMYMWMGECVCIRAPHDTYAITIYIPPKNGLITLQTPRTCRFPAF